MSSNIHIVVSPSVGDNWLVEGLTLDTPVATLRSLIADKLATASESVKLVFEGTEIVDGASLREWYITNYSTVRAVIGALPAAGSVPRDATPTSSLISDEEMPRAVVIRGIATAEPAVTEKALFDAFSRFGEVARLVFQDAPPTEGAPLQQAILVFYRDAAAAASLAADGSVILGAAVSVSLANSLLPVQHRPAAIATAGSATPAAAPGDRLLVPSEAVIGLLARGFLYGHEGIAHVRRYDERSGLTTRVKIWLDTQNSRFHVSQTVSGAYATAVAQAQQLERTWQELDARYRLHERLDVAASAAISSFEAAVSRAMRDPTINRLAAASYDFAVEAYDAIQSTVLQAKERARLAYAQQQQGQQPQPNGGTASSAVVTAPAPVAATSSASLGGPVVATQDPVPSTE